jgi:acetyl esterase/lipase
MKFNKKYYLLFILVCSTCLSIFSEEQCPVSSIDSGYGMPGPFQMVSDTLSYNGKPEMKVYVFKPQDTKGKVPCILFCPKFGSENPAEYITLIRYLTSKGFIVVYPPYQSQVFTRRSIETSMITDEMFSAIAQVIRGYADTTRIGFIGHSYGAGIIPAIAKRIIEDKKWGENGLFLYLMSPWYFTGMTKRTLENFPQNIKVVIQVFDNDNINDPRIGSHLFNLLPMNYESKKFFIVYGDSYKRCRLKSDFTVPLCENALGGDDNALDIYAIHRLCDAITKGVFQNDTAALDFVFRSGKTRKLYMGKWPSGKNFKEMIATDTPSQYISAKPYINPWISLRNPFADVTSFRQSRRLRTDYKRTKIKDVFHYLIDKEHKEDKDDAKSDENIDIFENPIVAGYGTEGAFTVKKNTINNPLSKESPTLVFSPVEKENSPLLILLHGYSGQDYRYFEPLITHVVSKGYTVIYPIYPLFPLVNSEKQVLEKYTIVKAGIEEFIKHKKSTIDTSRVAVMGQSFGGGMVPSVAYMMFNDKLWGGNGAFMYMTAPWYSYDITQKQLQSYPKNVKLIMEIFDDDVTNDHQMAVDLFTSITIPAQEKDFITLYSDSYNGIKMNANHFVPYGVNYIYGEQNLLDYYGIYKIFDAMADYAFNGNVSAKNSALGNGSKEQIYMGEWSTDKPVRPCSVTDAPKAHHSEFSYLYSWDNELNPRKKDVSKRHFE